MHGDIHGTVDALRVFCTTGYLKQNERLLRNDLFKRKSTKLIYAGLFTRRHCWIWKCNVFRVILPGGDSAHTNIIHSTKQDLFDVVWLHFPTSFIARNFSVKAPCEAGLGLLTFDMSRMDLAR